MKKKIFISIFFALVIILIAIFVANKKVQAPEVSLQLSADSLQKSDTNANRQEIQIQQIEQPQQVQPETLDPIDGAKARITTKPFGIFITKQNSPIQPERFSGYHTGIDLETTPDEQNVEVRVKALCEGKLLMAKNASGYGGMAVQSCVLNGQDVTIVYGHIKLASVNAKIGDILRAGDFLANLGKGFSIETDGERKHLHLGIHKGQDINILGYVQNKNQLNEWLNGAKYLN